MSDRATTGIGLEVPSEIIDEIVGAVRIGITFTSTSVLQEKLTLRDVIEIISPLDRNEAIALCAEWNRRNTLVLFKYGSWQSVPQYTQDVLDELLPPGAQMSAVEVTEDEDFISPFSETSVLALIALLCRYSVASGGESLQARRSRRALFRALLALQESIFPDHFLQLSVPDQFSFAFRVTLANVCLRNVWAYDMGRLHALLTIPEIARQLNGMTTAEWFLKRLNVDARDYQCVVNILLGSAYYQADYSTLQEQAPALHERMRSLLELSIATPEEVVTGLDTQRPQRDPDEIWQSVTYSNVLIVRPMLRLGQEVLCTSTTNLFNKIYRGLPYLCLEARKNRREEGMRPRDEFGYIFEGYVVWLMKQWLNLEDVRFVPNYWISRVKGPAERDIVIIRDQLAYVFEIKATVPTMKVRQLGMVSDMVAVYRNASEQAYTAAEALLKGECFEDQELCVRLPKVRRVVPCAVTYDFLGIRWPYSDQFETALEKATGMPLFSGRNGIHPFQILDVQQIEMWDDLFQLPGEINRLFSALEERAASPLRRYRDLGEYNEFRSDHIQNPGTVRKMVDAAAAASRQRLAEISALDARLQSSPV